MTRLTMWTYVDQVAMRIYIYTDIMTMMTRWTYDDVQVIMHMMTKWTDG